MECTTVHSLYMYSSWRNARWLTTLGMSEADIVIHNHNRSAHFIHILHCVHHTHPHSPSPTFTQHKMGVVHRDLKCENILLASDKTIRIADFGISALSTGLLKDFCGTPTHCPPELIQMKPYYGTFMDLWAMGRDHQTFHFNHLTCFIIL